MKKCPCCGEKVSYKYIFCFACGKKLKDLNKNINSNDNRYISKFLNKKVVVILGILSMLFLSSAAILFLFNKGVFKPIIYNVNSNLEKMDLVNGESKRIYTHFSSFPKNEGNNCNIKYEVKDKNILSINSSGEVKALQIGETPVSIKIDDKVYKKINVVVRPIKIKNLEINLHKDKYKVGENFNVATYFQTEKPELTPKLTYTSSDPSVVLINEDGECEALKSGEAIINVKVGDKSANAKIIVEKRTLWEFLTNKYKKDYKDNLNKNTLKNKTKEVFNEIIENKK